MLLAVCCRSFVSEVVYLRLTCSLFPFPPKHTILILPPHRQTQTNQKHTNNHQQKLIQSMCLPSPTPALRVCRPQSWGSTMLTSTTREDQRCSRASTLGWWVRCCVTLTLRCWTVTHVSPPLLFRCGCLPSLTHSLTLPATLCCASLPLPLPALKPTHTTNKPTTNRTWRAEQPLLDQMVSEAF